MLITVSNEELKIPKKQKPVTLWVHPEGRVVGAIFLYQQSENHSGQEQPVDVLNGCAPFVVLQREDLGEPRFYNKRSVVRVEYEDSEPDDTPDMTVLKCGLHMMDGSRLEGTIREFLPPEHRRLYDYINSEGEDFVKLHLGNNNVCLVNKAYIVHVTHQES